MNCPKCKITLARENLCDLFYRCPQCKHTFLDQVLYWRLLYTESYKSQPNKSIKKRRRNNRVAFKGNSIKIYNGGSCSGK